MEYILFSSDIDPGMRYEGLVRYAFDCKRWEGPNNIAHQSVYNSLFVPKVSSKGVEVIHKILDALILKVNKKKEIELIEIKKSLTKRMEQSTAIDLFDYLIAIIEN